jgi:hypothetical protein
VTTNFHRFANRALCATNLPAHDHNVWSALIADYAGNIVTSTVAFSSTGAVNPNAPSFSEPNVTGDGVLLMPDLPEIWMQGRVSGQGSTVEASVNGRRSIPMNRREDVFGYLLPLDFGTNVVVLVAADAGKTNIASRILLIERSDRYQAEITSPAFGKFANGENQSSAGKVSLRLRMGESNELTLASVSVNGLAASLSGPDGDGNVTWNNVTLPAPGCTNSVMPIIVSLCWTGTTFEAGYTNICQDIPLGLLEGYEIVRRETSRVYLPVENTWWWRYPGSGCTDTNWWRTDARKYETWDSFGLDCGSAANKTNITRYFLSAPVANSTWCMDSTSFTDLVWVPWSVQTNVQAVLQPSRGLWFEQSTHDSYAGAVYGNQQQWGEAVWHSEDREDGEIEFRAPFYYASNTVVVFTLEGVDYARPSGQGRELSNLWYRGTAPVAWSNEAGTVSYLLSVDGGQEYTISSNLFGWGSATGGLPGYTVYPSNESWQAHGLETYRSLSFTGFHNQGPVPKGKIRLSLASTRMYAPGTPPKSGGYSHEAFEAILFVEVKVARDASKAEAFTIEVKMERPNDKSSIAGVSLPGGYDAFSGWNHAVTFGNTSYGKKWVTDADGWVADESDRVWAYGDLPFFFRHGDYSVELVAIEESGMNGTITGISGGQKKSSGYWYSHNWQPANDSNSMAMVHSLTGPTLSIECAGGTKGSMKGKLLLRMALNSAEYTAGRVPGPIAIEWPGDGAENIPKVTITESSMIPAQIVEDLRGSYGITVLKEHGWMK